VETKTPVTANVTKLTPKAKTAPVAANVSSKRKASAAPTTAPTAPKMPDAPEMDWDGLSATERLEALRDNQIILMDTVQNLLNQVNAMVGSLQSMSKKVQAIIKVSEDGKELNGQTLKETVEEFNVEQLKAKVKAMLDNGLMVATDLSDELETFIVGRIEDKDGKILNPRMQTLINQIMPEDMPAVQNKKVGDKGELSSGAFFVMEEMYKPVEIIAPEAAEAVDKAIEAENDKVAADGVPTVDETEEQPQA